MDVSAIFKESCLAIDRAGIILLLRPAKNEPGALSQATHSGCLVETIHNSAQMAREKAVRKNGNALVERAPDLRERSAWQALAVHSGSGFTIMLARNSSRDRKGNKSSSGLETNDPSGF